jgi:hypothetical protein
VLVAHFVVVVFFFFFEQYPEYMPVLPLPRLSPPLTEVRIEPKLVLLLDEDVLTKINK